MDHVRIRSALSDLAVDLRRRQKVYENVADVSRNLSHANRVIHFMYTGPSTASPLLFSKVVNCLIGGDVSISNFVKAQALDETLPRLGNKSQPRNCCAARELDVLRIASILAHITNRNPLYCSPADTAYQNVMCRFTGGGSGLLSHKCRTKAILMPASFSCLLWAGTPILD